MKDMYDQNPNDVKKVSYEDFLLMFGLYGTYYMTCDERHSIVGLRHKALTAMLGYEMAMSIIGVQPMAGPVGQIFTLKTKYGGSINKN